MIMSWSAQPDIVTYNYVLTPTYAPTPVIQQSSVPLSSYSSLSGALDLPSAKSRPRAYSSHKARTSTSTGYAYPASHHDHPSSPTRARGRMRSNSQALLANHPGSYYYHDKLIQPVNVVQPPQWPIFGPANHVLVPQTDLGDEYLPKTSSYMDPKFRHPSITFQTVGIPELGVRVGKVSERYSPSIVGGDDCVFAATMDREIRLWILWPGYSSEPVQKRVKTHNGTITKDTLLMVLSKVLLDYTIKIQRKGIPVEQGYEDWTLAPRGDGRPEISGSSLFITQLHHRGGSAWQPEIWAPMKF